VELLLLVLLVLALSLSLALSLALSMLEVGVALPSDKVGKAGVGIAVTEDVGRVPVGMETLLDSTVALEVEELAREAGFTLRMSRFIGGGDCGRERQRTGAHSCTLEDGSDCERLWDAIGRDVVVRAGAWWQDERQYKEEVQPPRADVNSGNGNRGWS
jgi:hypothetical protein